MNGPHRTAQDQQQAATRPVGMSPHALRQCATRALPADVVAAFVAERLREHQAERADCAVRVGRLAEDRVGIVGSNGTVVWAIVRGGLVCTVFVRRAEQPSSPAAFDVDAVLTIDGATWARGSGGRVAR